MGAVGVKVSGDWLDAAACQRVFALLAEHQVFVVGGAVRDAALGEPVGDVDFATDATPDAVMALAEAAGLKAVPTGIAHGTVTLVVDHVGFEVTTFRRDVETDGRRAVVAFADDVGTDARRRDFTMNALYCAPDGTVLDPLGGWDDVQARRVRFIDDPAERIGEDALRILRFFRFLAWYGDPAGGIDADGLAACAAHGDLLDGLSAERVGHEMRRLLGAPDPSPAVAAMAASGVLARIAPGAIAGALPPLVHAEPGFAPRWQRRVVAMGLEAAELNWRFSGSEEKQLAAIHAALDADLPPDQAGYRFGSAAAIDAALIRCASLSAPVPDDLAARAATGADQAFPVRAADLMAFLSPGPKLGKALKSLEDQWVASGFALDRDALIRLARAG